MYVSNSNSIHCCVNSIEYFYFRHRYHSNTTMNDHKYLYTQGHAIKIQRRVNKTLFYKLTVDMSEI